MFTLPWLNPEKRYIESVKNNYKKLVKDFPFSEIHMNIDIYSSHSGRPSDMQNHCDTYKIRRVWGSVEILKDTFEGYINILENNLYHNRIRLGELEYYMNLDKEFSKFEKNYLNTISNYTNIVAETLKSTAKLSDGDLS